jgi:NCAIR mutase (PurE)-related protein
MDQPSLQRLLDAVADGRCHPDEAARQLRRLPFADLGFARVDHHRALRQQLPEAVFGPGKSPEQCAAIVTELLDDDGGGPVLLTRATDAQVKASVAAAGHHGAVVTATGGLSTAAWRPAGSRPGSVLVVTAGTADIPVARECTATLDALGCVSDLEADCGVAGIHRLLAVADRVAAADVVVVVAGMEGALASAVGGLTAAPVVAVPTSTGYGSSFEGVTALLAMLSSCASGVTVVGIDNGFGAACAASRLLR